MGTSKTHTFTVTLRLPELKPKRRKSQTLRPARPKIPRVSRKQTPSRKQKPKKRATDNIPPETPEEKHQRRLEYDRARNQRPERKESNRRYTRERDKLAKELGLCIGCHGLPIPHHTRCEACAERHREYRRRHRANKADQQLYEASGQPTIS